MRRVPCQTQLADGSTERGKLKTGAPSNQDRSIYMTLDLRSRNAQREKECYVRSFQCWVRTQTRTAHQLATSTERGKLDWCTSNNKNLHPWTYEAETPNAKKNVMFVVFSAGREQRRVLPISQLHPRNAASQTGALQTTKIYLLGLTKQKRPTRKRMLCSQFSVLGENTDAYRPLASYIHGTRQARLVHFKQQKFTSLDLRSRNAKREKECYVRSFQCWARTQTRTAHQLATSTERGKLDWCTSNNKNLHPWTYEAETPNAKKNVMFVVFSAGREHRRVMPISQLHPRNAASQTGALQTTKIDILGLTKQKRQMSKKNVMNVVFSAGREHRRVLPISQLHPRNAASQTGALQSAKIYLHGLTKQKRPTRKRMLCSQFSVLGENTDAYRPLASYIHGTRQARLVHFNQQKFTSMDLRCRNALREKECYVRSFQCWARTHDAYCPLASYIHGTRQARLVHFKQQKFTSLDLRCRNAKREKECYVRSFQCWARTQTRTAHQLATSTERGKLDWCTSNNKNLHPWTYEAEMPNAKKNVMFVVFSAGREHRRVLPISQLHPRNAASQTGALQTTKIYILGLTKQERQTRKRMLCSQFSVLGENTDAYCPLASYIHGTRQARLVHFNQQKFTSMDLRSRNAQREKECYVRSFQCWARTQTRTAHVMLATSISNAACQTGATSNNKNLHPWTYECRNYLQREKECHVRSFHLLGENTDAYCPLASYIHRNAASQTGALQATKIYILGLTKQKRPTRKRMLCSQFSVLGENTDAYCPLAILHVTELPPSARLVTSNNKNLHPWTYEADYAPTAKYSCYGSQFSVLGQEHMSRELPLLAIATCHGTTAIGLDWCTVKQQKFTSLDLRSRNAKRRKRMLCSQFSVLGREHMSRVLPLLAIATCHGTRQARLGKTSCQQKFTSLDLRSRNAQRRKRMLCSQFSVLGENTCHAYCPLASYIHRNAARLMTWNYTSNNKNLPPWTYEAETPTCYAFTRLMFSWWRWPLIGQYPCHGTTSIGQILKSWNYLYQQYSMSWN